MSFDKWLMETYSITWEEYLGLSDERQDELSKEYEESGNWE